MQTTSKSIALILALAISFLSTVFFSLLEEASWQLLLMGGAIIFVVTFVLIYIVLEALIFSEIKNIYSVLEEIQKKDLHKALKKSSQTSLFPLRKINHSINTYASAKNKEIEMLQQSDNFRREFIADISHELKTPIFAAQSFIHTLLDGAVDDKNVRYKFLDRAAKSLNTLEVLVQDLLTLNQMESGAVKFNFEEVELKQVVAENIELLEQKAHKRKIGIHFIYNEDKQYTTFADKNKISRAIQNLLANAIRYNHEGGKVYIQLKANKKKVKLIVRDNGKGIPPEDLNRVFERFYRVDKSRSREKGGTGLGLAIVKHILEGHQSQIAATSTVGKGSTFSFSLPLSTRQQNGQAEHQKEQE